MEAIYAGIALTGPTQSEHSGPVLIPWDRMVQMTPLIRRAAKNIKARGNKSSQVSFGCRRRYAGILAAMDARAMFLHDLPDSGELELSQYAGGQTLTLVATACLAPCPSPQLHGRALDLQFEFLIGELNSSIVDGEGMYLRNENGSIIRNEDGQPLLAE